jgi:hypothetical protein
MKQAGEATVIAVLTIVAGNLKLLSEKREAILIRKDLKNVINALEDLIKNLIRGN